MVSNELVNSTMVHEGTKKDKDGRHVAYQDTKKVWTIGYGTNLQTLAINEDQARDLLLTRLDEAYAAASTYAWFGQLNPARRDTVIEMVYNLGVTRFNGFHLLQAALGAGDYVTAAAEMKDSDWHGEVGIRAVHLEQQMLTGVYWNA
jgi:lysozyme